MQSNRKLYSYLRARRAADTALWDYAQQYALEVVCEAEPQWDPRVSICQFDRKHLLNTAADIMADISDTYCRLLNASEDAGAMFLKCQSPCVRNYLSRILGWSIKDTKYFVYDWRHGTTSSRYTDAVGAI